MNITSTDALELSATMNRIISKLMVSSTDLRTANAANIQVTVSAGGKSFSPTTGLATVNTGFANTVQGSGSTGSSVTSTSYLFLATDEQAIDVTIETLDAEGATLFSTTVEDSVFTFLSDFFAPNHLIDDSNVTLDNADNLRAHIFIHIIRHGNAWLTITDEANCYVHALKQALGVNTTQNETAFIQSFRTLGGGADTNSGEGMTNGGKETAFFWQGSRIAHHAEGVHLEAIVVVESERLVLDDALIKLEA